MDRVCRSVSGHSPTYVLSVIVGRGVAERELYPFDARVAVDQQRGEVVAKGAGLSPSGCPPCVPKARP
jgi:hypothetical protein